MDGFVGWLGDQVTWLQGENLGKQFHGVKQSSGTKAQKFCGTFYSSQTFLKQFLYLKKSKIILSKTYKLSDFFHFLKHIFGHFCHFC